MQKKQMLFKTKGMNRDLSVSAFNPEFAFENINLRLSTNENNTLMSWVNEKGTLDTGISFIGTPVGTAIIDHKLVVFTADTLDRIYVVEKINNTFNSTLIFQGNLQLNASHPLETHVSYEAENIQKVYWTDNFSQPRMINIAKFYPNNPLIINDSEIVTKFDFVTSAKLDSTLDVEKRISGGVFSPGVIQYCYTYFNKYGQQSNIINVSPLYYLTHSDRGASAEDKVSNSFQITITNPDDDFEMLRIYSIHRTSLDTTPIVLALEDFPIVSGQSISFIDTGTGGATVDPTELLFMGGREILALTMEEKDQTLFLGNITLKNSDVSKIQDYFDSLRESVNPQDHVDIQFHNGEDAQHIEKEYNLDDSDGKLYSNTFLLHKNRREVTTFKGGDYYRFGFQLQKYTGEWSEPIFIDDAQNDKYPRTSLFDSKVNLPYAQATLNLSALTQQGSYFVEGFKKTYKRIRPVIVYPEIKDRVTLCQGVLNPTVFNVQDRVDHIPFAQSSWFFRPFTINKKWEDSYTYEPTIVEEGVIKTPTRIPTKVFQDPTNYRVIIGILTEDKARKLFRDGGTIISKSEMYGGDSIVIFDYAIGMEDVLAVVDGVETKCMIVAYLISSDATTTYGLTTLFIENSWYADSLDNPEGEYFLKHFALSENLELHSFSHTLQVKESSPYNDVIFEFSIHPAAVKGGDEQVRKALTGYFCFTFHKDEVGSRVEFEHYKSIYTDVNHRLPGLQKKQTEIQSSVTKYETPFSDNCEPDTDNTNTQFFVDQSIVTLNSPDIELDTTVQGYPTSDAKLRIIGSIPITASASAHKIAISSSMLPVGYETNVDVDHYIRESTDFGKGELFTNTYWLNKSLKAGKRIVAEYLWEDSWPYIKGQNAYDTWPNVAQYLVYPWQASRSLNSDTRGNNTATSVLKTKVMSNILYSYNTSYFDTCTTIGYGRYSGVIKKYDFLKVEAQYHLMENDFIENIRLKKQSDAYQQDINYYPNIDKALVNDKFWRVYERGYEGRKEIMGSVLMRYKSNSHAVIALPKYATNDTAWLLPYLHGYNDGSDVGQYGGSYGTTFWGDDLPAPGFSQSSIDIRAAVTNNNTVYPFDTLWLAELYKDVDAENLFGGKGRQAIAANNWIVGGDAQLLGNDLTDIELKWTEGDTYYQRYDCLKTYPFSTEDPNQIVEILSFMCESHVNLDGRWDRNRGQRDNTLVMPQNFNLINPAYSQKDNFFSYKKSEKKVNVYPNLVTYTKTKEAGADIDQWTNITLASNLDLDGDKGGIRSIQKLNNQLFAFQDSGIAQILYNESVQISSTDGVPIEIANSQKVQGKRYYSNSIGCSNKHSICNTPAGIYFMDSNDKGIYLFNGQLNNLSNKFGFNTWCKTNIFSNKKWNPIDFEDFVTYYDRQNQDVLFINKDTALAFSEKLGAFTSFYDYGKTPYFCNLDEDGLWLKGSKLWKHRAGNYCNFFGEPKSFSTTLVGNPEPQEDKIFTNLEFRASVDDEGTIVDDKYKAFLPFDKLEAWNEYQKGYTNLKDKDGHSPYKHHTADKDSALLRKFRIWRCDIPRDNDTSNNRKAHPMDRMRNPWLYLKLKKEQSTSKRTEIHDIVMTYFD